MQPHLTRHSLFHTSFVFYIVSNLRSKTAKQSLESDPAVTGQHKQEEPTHLQSVLGGLPVDIQIWCFLHSKCSDWLQDIAKLCCPSA